MIKFGDVVINEISKQHVIECIENNHVTMGPKTELIERKWGELFGYKKTIAMSSGTSACIAANMCLYDIGALPGDEVIVPSLSFIATANSIRAAGFTPVFCDVKHDLLINEELIENLITNKTRAIMPVSLMGKPPKMDIIQSIAKKHGLYIIIDQCEGHGCSYNHKFMSEWGDISTYSCYAAHILFSGEMGFLCTNNDKFSEAAESIRSHGRKPKDLFFDHIRFGLNFKPTDLNASIGLGNIENFWGIFNKRKSNWNYLKDRLSCYQDVLWISDEDKDCCTSPHAFSITFKPNAKQTCEGLKIALNKNGIQWKRNFGCMATQHKCFEYLGHKIGGFPIAEYIGDHGIHIGVHQFLTDQNLSDIINVINKHMRNYDKNI